MSSLVKRMRREGASARTVAERACMSMTDISPNQSVGTEDGDAHVAAAAAPLGDLHLAVEDDEHLARRARPLAEDGLARGHADRLERPREVLEHLVAQRAEEADLAQRRAGERARRAPRAADLGAFGGHRADEYTAAAARRRGSNVERLVNTMRRRPGPA